MPGLRGVVHRARNVERAEPACDQQQADQEGGIADARHNEGLARGEAIGGVAPPKADQQVGAEPNPFPADVEGEEIIRQHQQEHGGDEQVEIGEEPSIAFLALHELGREQMDEEADAGDHQHHDQGERIEAQADRRRETANIEPVPQCLLKDPARGRVAQETSGDREGNDGREPDRKRADCGLGAGGQPPGAQHETHRTEQGS